MRALDATVGRAAERPGAAIPMADFHRLPGVTPQMETDLEPGELITAVTLPPPPAGVHDLSQGARPRVLCLRAGLGRGRSSTPTGGKIRAARIALGGVAHKPWRVPRAEAALVARAGLGRLRRARPTPCCEGARGYGHNDFKIPLDRRTLAAVLAATRSA